MTYAISSAEYHAMAEDSRRRGDNVEPTSPMNCYSIAACEVWALAMDRLAAGGCEPWELFMAFHRQAQLKEIFGVNP